MKSYVSCILDNGGWKAYEAFLFGLLLDFIDGLRDNMFGDTTDDVLRSNLPPFERLDPAELLARATPFFWMNMHRIDNARPKHIRLQAVRDVLTTAFDSYYSLLPDGCCFTLPAGERETLVLPRLGLMIPGSHSRLRRLGSRLLEVEAGPHTLTIDLTQRAHPYRARTWKIFDDESQFVIAIADPAVTTPAIADGIADGDMHSFSEKIACALRMIGSIDYQLAASIQKLIHWFVPLKMPAPSLHRSHSQKDMIGVIHLSEGYSGIRMCEAIIHEFHHNQLFLLDTTQKLAEDDQTAVYYSPWRPDPRPLSGLFHALYVFSAVVKFYGMAESTVRDDFDREEVHQRRFQFCQKLRIAISQVPRKFLTALGKGLLGELEDDLVRQEWELGLRAETFSEAAVAHARAWCRANPTCIQHLRWPGGVQQLIG